MEPSDNITNEFNAEVPDMRLLAELSPAAADGYTLCRTCLPAYPTYTVSGDIAQPRMGRILLMREMTDSVAGDLTTQATPRESCLIRRARERVCPSRVGYKRMINHALRRWRARKSAATLGRWLPAVVERPWLLRTLA